MKIDLHCHTKAVKKDEPESRNVSVNDFVDTLSDKGVRVVAITNHNCFDLEQYNAFFNAAEEKDIQVWPGIELDIEARNEIGHIIIVVDPKKAKEFKDSIDKLLENKSPDDILLKFENVLEEMRQFDAVIIAHYLLFKSKGFSEECCRWMGAELSKEGKILMVEPSNIKSVGIMYANDICGFIGSDVQDWKNYPSEKIPELKIPINSFKTFLLLLKKDSHVIETFISKKGKLDLSIQPFIQEEDSTCFNVSLIKDINIIFGGKGVGKTKILAAIKARLSVKFGESQIAFYEGKTTEAEYEKLIKRPFSESYFEKLNIEDCKDDFQTIFDWEQCKIPTTSEFYKGFVSLKNQNKISKFGFMKASFIKDLSENNLKYSKKTYQDITKAVEELKKQDLDTLLGKKKKDQLIELLSELTASALNNYKNNFISYYSSKLESFTITKMKSLGQSKTGSDYMPLSIGLFDFFQNRYSIYCASKKIKKAIEDENNILAIKEPIGEIMGKGHIFLETKILLNPNAESNILYDGNMAKKLKNALKKLNSVFDNSFISKLPDSISEFIESCNGEIKSLRDFMGIKSIEKIKKRNGEIGLYNASSGEKSMLLLCISLMDDKKDFYILDEPELSIGHKYINEVIVPKLKELSRQNKTIIISTHDANIAVRTLPLQTIYREYKKSYFGNLFIDKLICPDDNLELNWTETSLEHLEGGESAFLERKETYGK